MEVPLNALRAFALVFEHGGVRAAARELAVSHSSLSRYLAELEAWGGAPLIHRPKGRGGGPLPPPGPAPGGGAPSSRRELEKAVGSLREGRSSHSVVISTTASFAARWLLPRLPHLEALHPRLEVSVLVDQRPVDLQAAGVDLALRMGPGPWR